MPDDKHKDNKSSYTGDPGQKRFKKRLDEAGDIDIKPKKKKTDEYNDAFTTGSNRKPKNRMVYG